MSYIYFCQSFCEQPAGCLIVSANQEEVISWMPHNKNDNQSDIGWADRRQMNTQSTQSAGAVRAKKKYDIIAK